MKRMISFVMSLLLLLSMIGIAQAQNISDELIHEALLTDPGLWRESGFFEAQGHAMLGTQTVGTLQYVYLVATVGTYGFMGGYCIMTSGGSCNPCTLVFEKQNDGWVLKEYKQVESYLELPEIMPQAMVDKFYAGEYDAAALTTILQTDVQNQLELLGRNEVIGSYADAAGELPGLMTLASNVMICFSDKWPLGCTTAERQENGESYLYTTAWAQDQDAPEHFECVLPSGITYMDNNGTYGTLTLTKVRKADGELLQTITGHATAEGLIITLQDEYGQICYTLSLTVDTDGFLTYTKPVVTKEGNCRIDTSLLDMYIQ